jgi:hypothetical protein
MPTTDDAGEAAREVIGPADPGEAAGAMATFLTGLGFAPVGVLPLPAYTAFAWFLLQTPQDGPRQPDPGLVRAFLTTDAATGR